MAQPIVQPIAQPIAQPNAAPVGDAVAPPCCVEHTFREVDGMPVPVQNQCFAGRNVFLQTTIASTCPLNNGLGMQHIFRDCRAAALASGQCHHWGDSWSCDECYDGLHGKHGHFYANVGYASCPTTIVSDLLRQAQAPGWPCASARPPLGTYLTSPRLDDGGRDGSRPLGLIGGVRDDLDHVSGSVMFALILVPSCAVGLCLCLCICGLVRRQRHTAHEVAWLREQVRSGSRGKLRLSMRTRAAEEGASLVSGRGSCDRPRTFGDQQARVMQVLAQHHARLQERREAASGRSGGWNLDDEEVTGGGM